MYADSPSDDLTERRLKRWIDNLNDYDIDTCISAAEKLGKLGHPDAVDALINAMKNRMPAVAAAAAHALGELKHSRSVQPLMEIARSHHDVQLRTAAIKALGEIRDARAIATLASIIDEYLATKRGDRMTTIRGYSYALLTEAAYALRQIGTPEALRAARKADQI